MRRIIGQSLVGMKVLMRKHDLGSAPFRVAEVSSFLVRIDRNHGFQLSWLVSNLTFEVVVQRSHVHRVYYYG